jgi:hypothetical protein
MHARARRFIFAFGGAGAFTFLTAVAGLAGVGWNSRALLGLYSVLLVVMLLAQARLSCHAHQKCPQNPPNHPPGVLDTLCRL